MAENTETTTLVRGLAMGESARWHDGRFWCSDWVAGEILAVSEDGEREVVARSTAFPFCFDWTPDGTMLVTSKQGLERLEGGELVPHADLTALSEFGWNEVIVDGDGNAYVNGINFDLSEGFDFELGSKTGLVALVTPDGTARVVADEVAFPNGMAILPGGETLVVAESFASHLGAWDIEPDRSLSNRRVWAEVPGGADGIAADAEGAIWCATNAGAVRVREGGEELDRVEVEEDGFSCALGGDDGRTLFIVANEWKGYENIGKGPRTGHVYTTRVEVPAAR